MPRIPEDLVERVKEATDIVEIVSEHVQLIRRSGSNYFGLCPFHPEKTPSFSVNADRQIYHCFGCGAGGNVFKFLQEIDHISFAEAVAFLARRSGIPLPERSADRSQEGVSDQLYQAHELAQKYFHHLLLQDPQGQRALDYLHHRGLTEATIQRFGLGYAPPAWDALLKMAGRRGLSSEIMEKAGLALARPSGTGHYDRFRDRIIFPIANLSGRTIAFGARALQVDQEPKYLNSPETPIYHKGAVLYGLDQTREAICREGVALIVEGYMDLLSLVQAGIPNVAASAGTALTKEHCRLLARYAQQVVLVFDGDAAGTAAARRGAEALISAGLDARVVSLPPEHDPDTFVREAGAEAFRAQVASAQPVLDFYLQQLGQQHDLATIQGKVQALEAFKPLLGGSRDPVRRDLLLREIAQRLDLDERAVRQKLRQEAQRTRNSGRSRRPEPMPAPQGPPWREKEFLGLLLSHPRFLAPTAQCLTFEAFADPRCQALARLLFEKSKSASSLDLALLMNEVEDQELVQLISTCAMQGFSEADVEQQWRESVLHFQIETLTRQLKECERELAIAAQAKDEAMAKQLQAEHENLLRKRQALISEKTLDLL